MPNHVHVLIETMDGWPLSRVLHSWKSYTAHQVNKHLGRQGSLWRREYHDRFVRDETHLGNAVLYVHNNPVKAGLVERPEDWRFSSARRVEAVDRTYHVPYAASYGQE
ncbi:MAG: transposase [Anaerolineae bacterium]